MVRDTLVDFFRDRVISPADFLTYDDGYRSVTYTYDDVRRLAVAFAARLGTAGISKDDKLVLWGENRPEWVIAFWGSVLAGVVVVPIDYRASGDFVTRVRDIVGARVVVVGRDVHPPVFDPGVEVWTLDEIAAARAASGPASGGADAGAAEISAAPLSGSDLAEIIFTSGATAEPKGVTITHRNVLANIVPVEREVLKYRKYGRPFLPLRFLNLLPLSHMFGQAMATFIPPMLPGVTVFMRGYNPVDIVEQIRRRRISVAVSVPKILDVLREHLLHVAPSLRDLPATKPHVALRWWRHRRIHRLFGLKFWAFVVGAAPLDPELEAFWSRLGFLVIQGYGLTETAPIVTLNHPFRTRQGSVGTPIAGVEVRIAPDGEILVRGENVTSGYFNAPVETSQAFEEGWFHTGDIGALDEAGRLTVRGRKKEIIVTPEGLNVFPEDVERALEKVAGVREAAAVGATSGSEERVHAVLVVEPGVDPSSVVREANRRLADHQKIRALSVWPGDTLPRTEGTQKLKRRLIKNWVESGGEAAPPPPAPAGASIEGAVSQFAPDREVTATTTLDELGLSSLERVELMMALEQRFDMTIDEAAFATAATIGDLKSLVETREALPAPTVAAPRPAPERITFPAWNRRAPVRAMRRLSLFTWILPLARLFAWIRVEGLEHLASVEGPVVFAANHQSHMDAPVILAALPASWRYHVAPAMAKEFFTAHFHPAGHSRRAWLTNSLNYYLAAGFFNAFPLPQRETGTRQTLRYIGELVGDGCSILIFPEGRRTDAGEIGRFQSGIGIIAARLRVPVIPVRLEGLDRILHHTWRWARPGRARVAFGPPLHLEGEDYPALAARVEAAVKAL